MLSIARADDSKTNVVKSILEELLHDIDNHFGTNLQQHDVAESKEKA